MTCPGCWENRQRLHQLVKTAESRRARGLAVDLTAIEHKRQQVRECWTCRPR